MKRTTEQEEAAKALRRAMEHVWESTPLMTMHRPTPWKTLREMRNYGGYSIEHASDAGEA